MKEKAWQKSNSYYLLPINVFLPSFLFLCWMNIIWSSFVLDCLNWPNPHEFLGLDNP